MANPFKQNLSKGVADMKFMKRLSHGGQESEPAKDVLTEKWVVEGAHPPPKEEVWPLVEHSFVEFENLNTLGRFSYNKYNKDIEHLMARERGSDQVMDDDHEDNEEGTITAKEMARRYETLSDRPKVLGKRRRSSPPYMQ